MFRFNGCRSLFRLLLFAFRRFRSFSRSLRSRFPRTGHPLTLFTLILPMRTPPTWPLCDVLFGISHSVVSLQSLSRTALNVSLLHYIAFLFRLLVYLVPTHGGHGHVSKGVEGKSRRRYIRTNILHPHPPSPSPSDIPTPLHPYPPRLFPFSSRPPIVTRKVADCLFISLFVSNCCDLSCARPHIPGGPLHPQ